MPTHDNTAHDADGGGSPFAALLDLLNIGPAERVSICWQKPGGKFETRVPTNLADTIALATSTPCRDRCVWFGVNPVDPPAGYYGRGTAEHVNRAAALFTDIDLKAGGVADTGTADAITKEIAVALGQMPAAVVFSGHGGHPYWPTDPGDDAWTLDTEAKRKAVQVVYRRFERLCMDIAAKHGAAVDKVGDLSRVLRVPGSYNHKNPDDPIPVELTSYPYGGSGPLTFAEVTEALDAYGVDEYPEDAETLGEQISDPHGWEFADETTAYVVKMVAGWPADRPGMRAKPVTRHNWLVGQAVRLACAQRLGRIDAHGHQIAVETLESAFLALLDNHGEKRKPTPGEVPGALAWGRTRAATFTDERAAEEVGGTGTDADSQGGDETPANVTLPASFWESRPVLTAIRDAAWSMLASPDATLAITLAKLSASIPPGVRVDTGINRPLPMHTFVAATGRTGGFKTSAFEASEQAVRFVPSWSTDPMVMDSPVLVAPGDDQEPGELFYLARGGTGQGLVENYIGEVLVPLPDNAPKNAKPKTKRTQVRSNVLVSIDEGNGLATALADPNSIVGETLRELWSGVTTGQNNAKVENTRRVRRGTYSFGMIVGFQLSVLARMLSAENVELGTPQRFLFAWTGAPDIPDEPVADPGVLTVTVPSDPIMLCPALLKRVRETLLPLLRNGGTDDETESQRLALIIRVAALLAILDSRAEVTEDDWALAEAMADTSRAITRYALAVKRGKDTRARTVRRAEQVADAIAVHTATAGSGAERAAARIETAISTDGFDTPGGRRRAKWSGEDGIRKRKFDHADRDDADAGLSLLDERGRVVCVMERRTRYVELAD